MKLKTLPLPLVFGLTLFMGATSIANAANSNMRLYGTLVDEPCVIKPGDETISLEFGNVPDKTFYIGSGRTNSQEFKIHLSECDLSISKKVKVTFSGSENQAIVGKGLLALSPGSQAEGIAIGLENADHSPLRINQETSTLALNTGNSILRFYAFIQAEPNAIANQSIKRGTFSAIATFHLNYD